MPPTEPPPRLRFRELLPEPRRLWIRYRPTPWPGPATLWIDLATLGLGRGAAAAFGRFDEGDLRRLDDAVYLPPVAPALERDRSRLADRLRDLGAPLICQQPLGAETVSGALLDPTGQLLREDMAALGTAPEGATVLWPWVGGLTDRASLWTEGVERLAAAGVARVLPLALELSPKERRRLAESVDLRVYGDLFHRAARPIRELAARVHELGMAAFLPRPVPEGPRSLAVNRALAGHLAQIGELRLALGDDEVRAQARFRAARWIDRQRHDLESLSRDGNLGVLTWLDEESLRTAAEFLERGVSEELTALERRYLAPAGGREGRRP